MNSKLKTENFLQSVQSIIVEQTENGERIVTFLIDAMEGHLPDFQPCHKLQAARLLQKYSGLQTKTSTDNLDLPQPARRERRDERRADRHIQSELAQIVQEETDNGRAIVTFLVQAMEGELDGFKPCHRMSAAKELLHRGSQTEAPSPINNNPSFPRKRESSGAGHGGEYPAHPVPALEPDPEEQQRIRHREDAIDFSLHGPIHYETNKFPCACEDRLHDCDGSELTEQEIIEAYARPPMLDSVIEDLDQQDRFKARYAKFMARLNPDKPPIDINSFRWRTLTRDP